MYNVSFHSDVEQDISNIDKEILERIQRAKDIKISTRTEIYGSKFKGSLKDYSKIRIGYYRIIYMMRSKTVYILAVGHRKDIYKTATRRT